MTEHFVARFNGFTWVLKLYPRLLNSKLISCLCCANSCGYILINASTFHVSLFCKSWKFVILGSSLPFFIIFHQRKLSKYCVNALFRCDMGFVFKVFSLLQLWAPISCSLKEWSNLRFFRVSPSHRDFCCSQWGIVLTSHSLLSAPELK